MFQKSYQEQTRKFESKDPQRDKFEAIDLDEYLLKVSKKLESLEKQNMRNADSSDLQYDNNFGLLNFVYLPGGNENTGGAHGSMGGSGEPDDENIA